MGARLLMLGLALERYATAKWTSIGGSRRGYVHLRAMPQREKMINQLRPRYWRVLAEVRPKCNWLSHSVKFVKAVISPHRTRQAETQQPVVEESHQLLQEAIKCGREVEIVRLLEAIQLYHQKRLGITGPIPSKRKMLQGKGAEVLSTLAGHDSSSSLSYYPLTGGGA